MSGIASGPDVGHGNYGSVVCLTCQNANHIILLIKDANLMLAMCPGCGELSAAFKIDANAQPADVAREVENNRDIAELVNGYRQKLNPHPPAKPVKEN